MKFWNNFSQKIVQSTLFITTMFLTLLWICCYKEILTSTRFPHHNHLVKENIIQTVLPYYYYCSKCIHQFNFILHQNAQSFPLIKWDRNLFMPKTLSWSQNRLTHGKTSVIMNLFSIENVYLFPEVTAGVAKWIFWWKERILMKTDPFQGNLCGILNILL